MASAWIAHVKAYHSKHGGSYSAALKAAAKTWTKKSKVKGKKKKTSKKNADGQNKHQKRTPMSKKSIQKQRWWQKKTLSGRVKR